MRRKYTYGKRRSGVSPLLRLLILSLSIVSAAYIIQSKGPTPPKEEVKTPVFVAAFDMIEVPVPVQPVAVGTRLKNAQWKMVSYPKHQLPKGAIIETGPFMEAVAIAPLPAELPVFQENLSFSPQVINPVVERIPAGMRAITIKVDATTAVEGWAGSGSLVDVLLIAKDRTTVIAEKVRVLSAERSTEPLESSQTPHIPNTVTLLVTQEQCLAINTSIPLGRIAFALRSSNDETGWTDTVFTAEQLKGKPVVDEKKRSITGYASVREYQQNKAFALADGKWIPTDIKPTGFLVGEEKR